jgi:putative membrane protein
VHRPDDAGEPALNVAETTGGDGGGRGFRRLLEALGLTSGRAPAPEPATDRSTQLSEHRTSLSLTRTFMAAERTLMAWMRTSLSMISFGFTLVKVLEALETERGATTGWFGRSWSPTTLGVTLISIGTGALVVAVIQHRQILVDLGRQGLVRGWSLALTVSTFVAVLGVFAFGSLVLKF